MDRLGQTTMLIIRCYTGANIGWAGGVIPAHPSFPLLVVVGREKNLPTLHLRLLNVSYYLNRSILHYVLGGEAAIR